VTFLQQCDILATFFFFFALRALGAFGPPRHGGVEPVNAIQILLRRNWYFGSVNE
jgi:hypothetical protein